MTDTAPPARTAGEFATTPTEFARILKILMGKGGGGKPPIETIGLRVVANGTGARAEARHANKMGTATIYADWYGIRADPGTDFRFVTGQPDRLLDYVTNGGYDPEQPLVVRFDGAGRLTLSDGSQVTSMTTDPESDLVVPDLGIFGVGPNGVVVNTDPKKRPSEGAPWEDWAGKGYSVVKIPAAGIARILQAGALLFAHNYRGTHLRFEIRPDSLGVTVADPKDSGADRIVIDRLPGAVIVGKPAGEEFSMMYSSIDSLWSSLGLLTSPMLVLIHHPEETRVNLVAVENPKDSSETSLAYNCSWMRWKDPREGKKAAK